jgi:uncharacterized protein YegL
MQIVEAQPKVQGAPTDPTPLTGLDVVALVDHSPSMAVNDPEYIRLQSVKSLVDFLRFNVENSQVQRLNRVGVVEFSSIAVTAVPLTPVTGQDGDAIKSAIDDRAKVSGNIRTIALQDAIGGTNFRAAIEQAKVVFDASQQKNLNQRRLIVVITDGGPQDYTQRTDDDYYTEEFGRIEATYKKLFDLNSDRLIVIGIDITKPPTYWNKVEPAWEKLTGSDGAFLADEAAKVSPAMVEVVCRILNPGKSKGCEYVGLGYHFVPPYLKRVRFSFYKYETGATVTLANPTQQLLPKQNDDTYHLSYLQSGQRSESYTINAPEPGCWKSSQVGAGRVEVLKETVFNDLQLTADRFYTVLPLRVVLELKGGANGTDIVKELPDYPIHFTAGLMSPSGVSQVVNIKRVEDQYIFDPPVEINEPGEYQLSVIGSAKPITTLGCIDNNTPDSEFNVLTETFKLYVQTPHLNLKVIAGDAEPLLNYSAIPGNQISFQFTDPEDNHVIEFPTDYAYEVRGKLIDPAGAAQDVTLTREGDRFLLPGSYYLPLTGHYKLTVEVVGVSGKTLASGELGFTVANQVRLNEPSLNFAASGPLTEISITPLDLHGDEYTFVPGNTPRIDATLTFPSGQTSTVTLGQVSGTNTFTAAVDWKLQDTHPHTITIQGYVGDVKDLTPVFLSPLVINVTDQIPYLEPAVPVDNTRYPLRPLLGWAPTFLAPVGMDIRVVNMSAGKPASAESFFTDPLDKLFVADVFDSSGRKIQENVPLVPIGPSEQGVFGASLLGLNDPVRYRLEVRQVGRWRLDIPKADEPKPLVISFERGDPPIAWVLWMLVYAAILVTIGVVIVLWALNHVIWPKAKGKIFAQVIGDGATLYTLAITPKRMNHFSVKGIRSLSLKRIKISRASRSMGKGKQIEGVRIECYDLQDHLCAAGTLYAEGAPKELRDMRLQTAAKERYAIKYEL